MLASFSRRPAKARSFGQRLQQRSAKTNNHTAALAAKLEIRAHVLDAIGATEASVFDAFAGEGQMHARVWSRARDYAGCDLTWYRDGRLLYVADSLRVMRAIDLAGFNVFDFDAWGSPWSHAIVLAARRKVEPGQLLGVVLTEGSGLKLKMGGLPLALADLAGVKASIAGALRAPDWFVERAIAELARRMQCRIIKRWQAKGRTGARMLYLGLVLQGAVEKS